MDPGASSLPAFEKVVYEVIRAGIFDLSEGLDPLGVNEKKEWRGGTEQGLQYNGNS